MGVGTWLISDVLSDDETVRGNEATAKVRRVDAEGIVWCSIEGGADEFPCERRLVSVKKGDTVQVRIDGGTATITGNASDPSASSEDAQATRIIAQTASESAATARTGASIAQKMAEAAQESAAAAADIVEVIEEIEEEAQETFAQILSDAVGAASNAEAALDSATAAQGSATAALQSAKAALYQLERVEDVVGTLTWIAEHSTDDSYTSTSDTSAQPGKYYFARSGSGTSADPYTYSIAESLHVVYSQTSDTEPVEGKTYYVLESGEYVDADVSEGFETGVTYYEQIQGTPANNGLYEFTGVLDATVQNYLSSHLALTDEGLWVTKDGTGCHLLIAGDRLSFRGENGIEVAYIAVDPVTNESTFYMTKAVVVKNLRFGHWEWRTHTDGSLSLKWTGSDS